VYGGVVVPSLHAFCVLLEVANAFRARLTPGGASVICAALLVAAAPASLFTVTVYAPTFAAVTAGTV
jgi:hypothetical protein